MTTQNRANEILSQITAFSKTGYTKAEYLPELMKLQDEVVKKKQSSACGMWAIISQE